MLRVAGLRFTASSNAGISESSKCRPATIASTPPAEQRDHRFGRLAARGNEDARHACLNAVNPM